MRRESDKSKCNDEGPANLRVSIAGEERDACLLRGRDKRLMDLTIDPIRHTTFCTFAIYQRNLIYTRGLTFATDWFT